MLQRHGDTPKDTVKDWYFGLVSEVTRDEPDRNKARETVLNRLGEWDGEDDDLIFLLFHYATGHAVDERRTRMRHSATAGAIDYDRSEAKKHDPDSDRAARRFSTGTQRSSAFLGSFPIGDKVVGDCLRPDLRRYEEAQRRLVRGAGKAGVGAHRLAGKLKSDKKMLRNAIGDAEAEQLWTRVDDKDIVEWFDEGGD